MTKTSSTTAEEKTEMQSLTSIERRKLKKIAVEKQRRARMNRSLATLRHILQEETGELEDADTAQVLDMAVSVLRQTRTPNLARSGPYDSIAKMAASTPRALPPLPISLVPRVPPLHGGFSDCDIRKLAEYQQEMDQSEGWKQQNAGYVAHAYGFPAPEMGFVNPEGLLLRNMDYSLRADHAAMLDPRSAYWRPW